MSILEQIQKNLPDYSRSERKIADYLLEYPFDIQKMSSETLAEKCSVSRSAIVRFCHKLGFNGYMDFRYAFLSEPIHTEKENAPTNPQMNKTLGYYDQVIQTLRESDAPEKAEMVADYIVRSTRVITFGQFHSNLSAQQLTYRLLRNHIDSLCINDITNFEAYTRLMNPGDTVILFSIAASAEVYLDHIKLLKSKRVTVVLFTMETNNQLQNYVDQYIVLPSAIHFGKEYMLDDAISFFLAIELIMEAIYRKYGKSQL